MPLKFLHRVPGQTLWLLCLPPHLLHSFINPFIIHPPTPPDTSLLASLGMGHSMGMAQDPALAHKRPRPGLAHLGHLDDVWDVQVGLHWGEATADEVGFIRFLPVHLARVLLRVHSHSADAQLRAGPKHTDGNLTWGGGTGEKLDSWVLREADVT